MRPRRRPRFRPRTPRRRWRRASARSLAQARKENYRPARRAAQAASSSPPPLAPQPLALAQHPAAEAVARQPARRKTTARRRAEQRHAPNAQPEVRIERFHHHQTAQTVAGEMRRTDPAPELRQTLRVRGQRSVTPGIVEQMTVVAGARQARGQRRHREPGHPQPMDQDDGFHIGGVNPPSFQARKSRSRGRCADRPIPDSSWRSPGASRRAVLPRALRPSRRPWRCPRNRWSNWL